MYDNADQRAATGQAKL